MLRLAPLHLALLATATATTALAGDQITLNPVADNTLYETPQGDLSNGAGPDIFAGTTAPSGGTLIRRALLRFDVAASIPAGSTITGVRVTLECTRVSPASASTTQSLHRVLSAWGEGTSVAPGMGGSGAPAANGDATWLHTFFSNSFWTAPGGDFNPIGSASQLILLEDSYDFVSQGLIDDVQAWLDGTAPDHGWMIKDDAGLPGDARRWASREAAAIIQPMLVIDFDLPQLGTNYCGPAAVNASGASAEISATGSTSVAANDLTLTATSLPIHMIGFFILSETQGFVMGAGGSDGNLCLGGAIGRFQTQIQSSGLAGTISIPVDLTTIPSPTGSLAIVAGSTWHFQAWFRDGNFFNHTANYTDGLTIQFQ